MRTFIFSPSSDVPADVLLVAKRAVVFQINYGHMMTPRDAWISAGLKREGETLWSIAFKIASHHDVSAEEVNRFLEAEFPRYTMTEGRHHGWDDHHAH